MSNLFKYTKRVLTSVLAAAVVLTAIPSTAFGAEQLPDEDFAEAFEVQEAEVADEAVVDEEAATTDGTGNDEAEIIGEEEAPDTYTADATITVVPYNVVYEDPGNLNPDRAGIFTINGSTAEEFDAANIEYDSDDSQDVYIVPVMGYALEASPFTLEVSWQKKGEAETTYADYAAAKAAGIVSSISSVDVSEAINNTTHGAFDGSKAIKITFPSGSSLANAFAGQKDGSIKFETSKGPKATLALAAHNPASEPADDQAKASTVKVYAYEPGNTTYGRGSLLGSATYDADWTGVGGAGIDVVGSSFDWTGVTEEVGILKGFDKEGKPEWVVDPSDTNPYAEKSNVTAVTGETGDNAYCMVGGKKLAINAYGINSGYVADLNKGYELAIVLTRSEEDVSKVHTLSAAASDYYTVTSSTLNKTDATTKAKSGKVNEEDGDDVYLKVKATSAGSGDRKLSKIYYKVGDEDAVAFGTGNVLVQTDLDDLNTAEHTSYDDSAAGLALAKADGWVKLAKSDITADTELYATTTEQISFNAITTVASSTDDLSTVSVLTVNAAALKNEATAISPTIVKDVDYDQDGVATSLSGKPYSFSVVPATGYGIKEVVAKVYAVNGTGYDTVNLTGTAVNGIYTIDELVANADVTIKTEELGTQAATIELTANPTGASLALSATGEPITTSDKPSIKIGTDVKFAATVAPGYWIKKLEYKVGASGATETLEPTSISSKGVFSYTIPASKVTGQVNVTVTMGDNAKKDSVKITKLTNTNAKITVDGTELKDFAKGDYMIVPTSKALSFVVEPQGDAKTDKVAFQALSNTASTDGITDLDSATPLTSGSTTYVITTEQLKAEDRDDTKGIAIIATTKEEVAASSYKTVWNSTVSGSPNKVDPSKGEVLSKFNLVAGGASSKNAITSIKGSGSDLLDNINIVAEDTVSATFYKADGKTSVGAGTTTYKLGITGDNAVATISTATLTSTNKAGDDVITAEHTLTSSFPHSPVYTATLPVSVAALNTVFDDSGLSLATSIQDKAATDVTTNVEKAGLDLNGNTIREETASYQDIAVINPLFTDENADGTDNSNALEIDTSDPTDPTDPETSLVSSIKWTAVNNSGEKYDPDYLDPSYGLYTSTNYAAANVYKNTAENAVVLAAGQEEQTVDVTATITYLDGTTDTITYTMTIAPATLGYMAIQTLTIGGMDPAYNIDTLSNRPILETVTTSGLNKATLKFDVYEVMSGIDPGDVTSWEGSLDAADVKDLVDAGALKAVTTGIDFGKGIERVDGYGEEGVVSVSGSGLSYTITAGKVGHNQFVTDFSVDGVPVSAGKLYVNVVGKLPTLTVTLNTDNASAPYAKTADFDAPKLKDSAAWLSKPHGTTLGGGTPPTPIAYTYKNIAEGTKVTLPTQADFDDASYDHKKVLWAWVDNVGGAGHAYAPGATVTVGDAYEFTPVWASKYTYDGSNEGVKAVVGNAKDDLATTTNVAVGATVPVFIQFQGLDYTKRAKLIEEGKFTGAIAYVAAADAETTQTGMELSFTTSSAKASLVENGTAVKGADSAGVDPVLKVEFVEFKGTDYEAKYTPDGYSSTTIKVKSAQTYSITADTITVEANQVKPLDVTIKLTTDGADTELDLDDGTYLTGTPSKSIQVTGVSETVAKVKVNDTTKKVEVTGLKAGQSTTATLVLTDKNGTVTTSQPVTIKVVAATKQIVANRASSDTAYWDDNAGVLVGVGASGATLHLALKDLTTQAIESGSNWTVKDSTPDSVPAARKIYTGTPGDVDIDADTGVLSYTAETGVFGEATIDVTATVSGITYMATIPVTSMYPYTFSISGANTEVYEDGTKAAAAIVKPVFYTGAKTYTVPNSNKITATWTGTGTPQFLGWGASYEASGTVADTKFLAGESYVIKEEDLAATTLETVFGEPEIAVAGLPAEIVLTDESLATGTAAGTDALKFSASVTPATSASPVTITADKKSFVTLDNGDKTKAAIAGRNLFTDNSTITPPGGAAGKGLKNVTAGSAGSRIIDFTVGSNAKPGTGNVLVEYNGLTTKIPVYVNGEYNDATVTPAVDRYLERGEVLKEGVRTVNGQKHYYKDSARVIKGAVKTEDGKTVLIVSGNLYTTVGAVGIDDKVYYVGSDGYVKTGGLFVGEAAGDKTKTYFANEDGTLVAGELKQVSGKTYYFNGTGVREEAAATANLYAPSSDGKYYVNAAGEVAISGIFKVEGKDRLFRADGTIVKHTDADVVAGGGKLVVDGVTYLIADDDTAKRDDIWYNPTVDWTQKFPSTWSKTSAIPTIAYTVTYTSANDGKSYTTDSVVATVTSVPSPIPSDATEVTFTATADLSSFFQDKAGTKKAENKTLVKAYKFPKGGESGQSGQNVDPSGDISIEGLEESYPWTGKQIKPAFKVYDNVNGRYLAQGVDFTVKYGKNKDAGQGTVTITGKGNYAKTGTAATFSIVKEAAPEDPAGQVNGFGKIAQQTYTGSPIYPETIDVKLKDKTVVTMKSNGDGTYSNSDTSSTKELLVVVTNNVNKGSATVAATGSNGVTKTTTFKINAKSMEGANATGTLGNPFEVSIDESVDYRIKNTTPEVSIKYNGDELVEGQDFTAKFDAKKGKVTVTGKNNFTKKFVQEGITVNPLNLSDCKLVAVTAYEGLKYTAVKATVLDPDGNLVPAGKYTLDIKPDDDAVGSNGKLIGGKNIKVVAKANGKDSLITGETSEEDFTVAKNFGKASIKVTGSKEYTGEAIELDDDWVNTNVTVKYSGSVIKCGDDFEIVGYTNNVKKGTMTVYCAGKGEFSGTKNFKVKITAKPFGTK